MTSPNYPHFAAYGRLAFYSVRSLQVENSKAIDTSMRYVTFAVTRGVCVAFSAFRIWPCSSSKSTTLVRARLACRSSQARVTVASLWGHLTVAGRD